MMEHFSLEKSSTALASANSYHGIELKAVSYDKGRCIVSDFSGQVIKFFDRFRDPFGACQYVEPFGEDSIIVF